MGLKAAQTQSIADSCWSVQASEKQNKNKQKFVQLALFTQAEVTSGRHLFFCDVCMRSARAALYLQDVALLDGGVLQLAGLLLQSLSCAANRQTGQYLFW